MLSSLVQKSESPQGDFPGIAGFDIPLGRQFCVYGVVYDIFHAGIICDPVFKIERIVSCLEILVEMFQGMAFAFYFIAECRCVRNRLSFCRDEVITLIFNVSKISVPLPPYVTEFSRSTQICGPQTCVLCCL